MKYFVVKKTLSKPILKCKISQASLTYFNPCHFIIVGLPSELTLTISVREAYIKLNVYGFTVLNIHTTINQKLGHKHSGNGYKYT